MKLGKNFVNSMVREVGRNYGKAISNTLLGDRHSTPYRRVGSQKRQSGEQIHTAGPAARKRMNKLENIIRDFTRKTTESSILTQALNIYDEYFNEVSEARQNGGAIDLSEALFLVEKSQDVIRLISNSIEQLQIINKTDKIPLLEEKATEIRDFIMGIDQFLREQLDDLEKPNPNINLKQRKQPGMAALFSIVGLGKAYTYNGFGKPGAVIELIVWVITIIAIYLGVRYETLELLAGLFFFGYFMLYVPIFSWRPIKVSNHRFIIENMRQTNLRRIENDINNVLEAIERIA
ncbi:MAG: hypothetical protein JJU02_07020 [Cryomorphaceae bacterium]|nr:hypothetical protein [Cryomorphaceae bacterium]